MSQYPLRIKLKKNSLNFHEGAQFGLKIIQINGLKQYLYIESETGAIISADLYYTNKEVFDDISPSIGYYKDEVGEEKIIDLRLQ